MASPEATKFAELAQIFLAVVQMLISLERVKKYEEKLNYLAETLFKCGDACPGESLAIKHRCRYRDLRNQGTMGFVKYTSSVRAQNYNAEMKRKMEDQLLHWRMLVSIPVEQEGNYANFNPAISAWTQSMGNWAQGFNSGAAAFGTSLYNLIHSGNQNQRTYGSIPVNTAGQQTISIGWPNNVART